MKYNIGKELSEAGKHYKLRIVMDMFSLVIILGTMIKYMLKVEKLLMENGLVKMI